MKKHALHILSLGAVTSLGIAGILNSPVSFADDSMQNETKNRPERPAFMENIVREVEKTDTGVIITMTSEDAEAIAKLQEGPQHKKSMEGVTEKVTKLSNGIQIELSSDDEETIEKLQNRSEKGFGPHGDKGEKGGKAFWMHHDKIQKSITKNADGISIQLSTEDAETLAELHAFEFPTFEPKTEESK